ncbi:MAG: heavy-metal-associated domain-containing protein [Nitrospirae bacterium]|nr:heavy-metal-associated domain-containing protein [Nitrospirota bacterium]
MTASFAVEALDGVKKVDDDQEKHTLTIVFDDRKVTVDAIKEALIKANHRVEGNGEIVPK